MQLEVVKDYYGKTLKSTKDLKTSACCDCETSAGAARAVAGERA